jgi:hypothetical protein
MLTTINGKHPTVDSSLKREGGQREAGFAVVTVVGLESKELAGRSGGCVRLCEYCEAHWRGRLIP